MEGKTENTVLVIGGGISGITAAVEAAETGCRVFLVEKLPYLGGHVARVNEYFPKLCPPYCGLEINFRRIRNSERIQVITSATIQSVSGLPGHFKVRIMRKPEFVTSSCTICGDCSAVCPVETEDAFNYGLSRHKAIDLPHELAFPARYYLDESACRKNGCRACEEACNYQAINLNAEPEIREIEVGSILICTGWSPYDPENLSEYSWGASPNILTNVMMERLGASNGPTRGRILKQPGGEPVDRIAFIQCAGSRDENHLPYCSAVCCSASLKQALYYAEQNPEGKVDIYYIDLRVSGRNEDFLKKVEDHDRIRLIKGKVSAVKVETGNAPGEKLRLEAEDILSGYKVSRDYDMVVLATGIIPNVPSLSGIETDSDGFVAKEALETGMTAGGCCFEPKDVAASVRESTGLLIHALHQNTPSSTPGM
jgi:heterodisulfide reductase subunit A-like polyferredoxin